MCSTKEFKERPYGLFLFVTILSILKTQEPNNLKISNIAIEGNSKTKDYIVFREIHHPLNESIDTVKINEDKNRLENLGIFSGVSWSLLPLEDGTFTLKYIITESIQKTPPTVFPSYNESKGWSLNALWFLNNFRGRNQLLALSGSVGGEDTYGITFNDPWIFNDHISFSINIIRNLYEHRFLNCDVDLNSLKIGFGKWFGDKIKTNVSFALESKSFTKKKEISLLEYFYFFSNMRYDTRDIYWNPGKGFLFSNSIQYIQGSDLERFQTLVWDQSYSYYINLKSSKKKTVLAINGLLKQKLGDKHKFFQDYIGSSNTIRGWPLPDSISYEEEPFRFGHDLIQTTIEYRYEIIPKYITSFGIESGLVFVVFTDAGLILDYEYSNDLNTIIYGSGIGVRIPFPLVGVIRFDVGIGIMNKKWNSNSFHFGIGQKF